MFLIRLIMDSDDPRQPLLGSPPRSKWRHAASKMCNVDSWKRKVPITIWVPQYTLEKLLRDAIAGSPPRSKWRHAASKMCNVDSWKRKVPITIWVPQYTLEKLLRDAIAGITVGLTSIPQGIAYAIVAGLPPQVGLYGSIFPAIMYAIFGSCKQVTVGPTAILSALLTKYVSQSADFAYLAAFLTGFLILLLGILQLGFLLDFISKPVISGFTTAAAFQISASQLKSLFGVSGKSGGSFIEALINFFKNIKTVQLWDSLLGLATMALLFLLKRCSPSASSSPSLWSTVRLYAVRARNALVVFAASAVAYILYVKGDMPFKLTGTIEGGLPTFGLPPFKTTVNNETIGFDRMLEILGPQGFVMPLVAILESIAIAKAFAGSNTVDATQEMIALGMCNLVSSFAQCMPTTGSFTRTALNHSSGVMTPAGTLFQASLVLLAVTLLAETFYFIPRATLAGIIMVAMISIADFSLLPTLWNTSKSELSIWVLTVLVGVTAGLEYGIAAGVAGDALRVLYASSRPHLQKQEFKVGSVDVSCVSLSGTLSYSCGARVSLAVRSVGPGVLVVCGQHVRHMDIGVLNDLISAIEDLEKQKQRCLLWNFPAHIDVDDARRVTGTDIRQIILDLDERDPILSAVTS